MPWYFPGRAQLCGMEGLSEPFCHVVPCGSAGTIGQSRGVGLPALCPAGRPVSPISEGVAVRAGAARWASTRRSRLGHTTGRSAICACGSSTSEMPGWLPGSATFWSEARSDGLSSPAVRCLGRTGSTALVAALAARLQPGRGAAHGLARRLDLPVHRRCGALWRRPSLRS